MKPFRLDLWLPTGSLVASSSVGRTGRAIQSSGKIQSPLTNHVGSVKGEMVYGRRDAMYGKHEITKRKLTKPSSPGAMRLTGLTTTAGLFVKSEDGSGH